MTLGMLKSLIQIQWFCSTCELKYHYYNYSSIRSHFVVSVGTFTLMLIPIFELDFGVTYFFLLNGLNRNRKNKFVVFQEDCYD